MTTVKKSFFSSILTAALLAVGAVSTAAEPTTDPSARLAAAKEYYVNGFVEQFKSGWNISQSAKLSDTQAAAVKTALNKWLNDEFMPYLTRNGILDEWVAMQLDEDRRKISRRILEEAKTREEILMISREGDALFKKRYPKLAARLGTPELNNLMIRLQRAILSAATKNR